jgi:ankyrin repeat protein
MNLADTCERGKLEVVKRLLSEGVALQSEKQYAMRRACYKGNLELVKLLIEHGADVRDAYAINYASTKGHLEVIEYIKKLIVIEKLHELN